MTRPISWPDWMRCCNDLLSHLVSLLLPLTSLLFTRTKGVSSHQNYLTLILLVSTEELVLPRHTSRFFSSLCCNRHSLLSNPYLSRIGGIENPHAAPVIMRPTTLFIPFCALLLRTFCAALSLTTPFLCATSGPGRLLGRHGLLPFPILWKGMGNNNPLLTIDYLLVNEILVGFDSGWVTLTKANSHHYSCHEVARKRKMILMGLDLTAYWIFMACRLKSHCNRLFPQ